MVNILNASIKGAKNNTGRNSQMISLPLISKVSVMHPIRISNIKRPQQYTGSAQIGGKIIL